MGVGVGVDVGVEVEEEVLVEVEIVDGALMLSISHRSYETLDTYEEVLVAEEAEVVVEPVELEECVREVLDVVAEETPDGGMLRVVRMRGRNRTLYEVSKETYIDYTCWLTGRKQSGSRGW